MRFAGFPATQGKHQKMLFTFADRKNSGIFSIYTFISVKHAISFQVVEIKLNIHSTRHYEEFLTNSSFFVLTLNEGEHFESIH